MGCLGFPEKIPYDWILSARNAGCPLSTLFNPSWICCLIPEYLGHLGFKCLVCISRWTPSYLLSEWDLGVSFSNFMYSRICIVLLASKWLLWLTKCLATVVLGSVSNIKNMTLESVKDSISSLSYIFNAVPILFQAVNEVVALTDATPGGIVGF